MIIWKKHGGDTGSLVHDSLKECALALSFKDALFMLSLAKHEIIPVLSCNFYSIVMVTAICQPGSCMLELLPWKV